MTKKLAWRALAEAVLYFKFRIEIIIVFQFLSSKPGNCCQDAAKCQGSDDDRNENPQPNQLQAGRGFVALADIRRQGRTSDY